MGPLKRFTNQASLKPRNSIQHVVVLVCEKVKLPSGGPQQRLWSVVCLNMRCDGAVAASSLQFAVLVVVVCAADGA